MTYRHSSDVLHHMPLQCCQPMVTINVQVFMECSSLFHDQKPVGDIWLHPCECTVQVFIFCPMQSFSACHQVLVITVPVKLPWRLSVHVTSHPGVPHRFLFTELLQQTLHNPAPEVILLSKLLEVTDVSVASFHYLRGFFLALFDIFREQLNQKSQIT